MSALITSLALLSACGQRNDSFTDCGGGETQLIGNDRYCVYSNALIIEGFDCPVQMSYHEVPGGVVCSPNPSGEDLPGTIKDPFDLVPVGVDPVMTPPGKLYPVAEDPDLFGQPDPDGDVFDEIYRSKGYACAVDGMSAASCWGPKLSMAGSMLPDVIADVAQMALAEDALCVLDSNKDATCYGNVTWTLPPTPHQYRHISLHDDGVFCGIKEGSMELECVGQPELVRQLEQQGFANVNEAFRAFDVRHAEAGPSPFACGVLRDGRIKCNIDGVEAMTDATHSYEKVAVIRDASSGEVHMAGLIDSGEVDLWRGASFVQDPGSWFSLDGLPRFDELHSAYCGKPRFGSEVVCWQDVFDQVTGPRVTTTLKSDTRAMAQSWDASGVRWCAILTDGELECSDFSL